MIAIELEALRDEATTIVGAVCRLAAGAGSLASVNESMGRLLVRINAARPVVGRQAMGALPVDSSEWDLALEAIVEWAQLELARKGRSKKAAPTADDRLRADLEYSTTINDLRAKLETARDALSAINVRATAALGESVEPSVQSLRGRRAPRQEASNKGRTPERAKQSNGMLHAGQRRMMTTLAAFSPLGLTRYQLGYLARVASSSGTFSNYFGELQPKIVALPGKRYTATDEAVHEFGGPNKALRTHGGRSAAFKERLEAGARRMLEELEKTAPHYQLDRDVLGARARVSSSSGTFSNYLSRLVNCDLVVAERGQPVRLSPWLVEGRGA